MEMRMAIGLAAAALLLGGCVGSAGDRPAAAYRPQLREVTLTTVPLLVHEQEKQFPFLAADFAKGGVLEGREAYAFVPGTITVIAGDTLHLTVINPEDDAHNLVLPGLSLALPGQQSTHATYVARTPGIFAFTCNMPAHLPIMWGQLVVLSPRSVGAR